MSEATLKYSRRLSQSHQREDWGEERGPRLNGLRPQMPRWHPWL